MRQTSRVASHTHGVANEMQRVRESLLHSVDYVVQTFQRCDSSFLQNSGLWALMLARLHRGIARTTVHRSKVAANRLRFLSALRPQVSQEPDRRYAVSCARHHAAVFLFAVKVTST